MILEFERIWGSWAMQWARKPLETCCYALGAVWRLVFVGNTQ